MTWPQKQEGPGNDGNRSEASKQISRDANANTDPSSVVVGRLDGVRRSGKGWIAKCPAHEDRTASLAVTVGEDSRVLLHCFAGCTAHEVLAALGMQLADLFVRKPTSAMTFAERSALREYSRQAQWRAALNVLGFEAKILQIAGRDLKLAKPLGDEDQERLVLACDRIDDAREVLNARSH